MTRRRRVILSAARDRVLVLALVLAAACATRPVPSLELLREDGGTLSWSGIRLGMRVDEVSRLVGHVRRTRGYADVCGDSFSEHRVAGRTIEIRWSSDARDAEVETIWVPLTAAERSMDDNALSRVARATIPAFIDRVAAEYDRPADPDPMSLALEHNRDAAVMIVRDREQNLVVTLSGCID